MGRLLDADIVAEIDLFSHTVNFVSAASKKQSQTETSSNWTEVVQDLVPFSINRVSIVRGEIHNQAFPSKPAVDIYVQKLNAVARNLTNSKDLGGSLVASFDGDALAMGGGRIKFRGKVNLQWQREKESLPDKLWQGLAEVVGELLEDQGKNRVATRVPFEGRIEDPSGNVWSTLGGLLENAFIEALRRGVEGRIELNAPSEPGSGCKHSE